MFVALKTTLSQPCVSGHGLYLYMYMYICEYVYMQPRHGHCLESHARKQYTHVFSLLHTHTLFLSLTHTPRHGHCLDGVRVVTRVRVHFAAVDDVGNAQALCKIGIESNIFRRVWRGACAANVPQYVAANIQTIRDRDPEDDKHCVEILVGVARNTVDNELCVFENMCM